MASGFLTFNRAVIDKLFWVIHAKSIANLCKLSHVYSHWIFVLLCQLVMKLEGPVFPTSVNFNLKQLLDKVEQNIVICQWRADQLFPEAFGFGQIIDLFYHSTTQKEERRKKEKSVVSFTHEENIICSQTLKPNTAGRHKICTLADTLFVVRYLQVTWWALCQWKGRNICIE